VSRLLIAAGMARPQVHRDLSMSFVWDETVCAIVLLARDLGFGPRRGRFHFLLDWRKKHSLVSSGRSDLSSPECSPTCGDGHAASTDAAAC
jgi:hypothetical protein